MTSSYGDDYYSFEVVYIDRYGRKQTYEEVLYGGDSFSLLIYKIITYGGGDTNTMTKTGDGIVVYDNFTTMLNGEFTTESSSSSLYGTYAITNGATISLLENP